MQHNVTYISLWKLKWNAPHMLLTICSKQWIIFFNNKHCTTMLISKHTYILFIYKKWFFIKKIRLNHPYNKNKVPKHQPSLNLKREANSTSYKLQGPNPHAISPKMCMISSNNLKLTSIKWLVSTNFLSTMRISSHIGIN